ncbi:hypothetical protein HYW21_00585 [Candidatus Woesearchaeota archaeon]|nr:hypothetical protein [Candidatus Woesearchaeota archaeon]
MQAVTFADMIKYLSYEELEHVHKDLTSGGFHAKKAVAEQLAALEQSEATHCTVCGEDLNLEAFNNYAILFGPKGFRKKASFCALDCLEYFVTGLKQTKNTKKQQEQNYLNK